MKWLMLLAVLASTQLFAMGDKPWAEVVKLKGEVTFDGKALKLGTELIRRVFLKQ